LNTPTGAQRNYSKYSFINIREKQIKIPILSAAAAATTTTTKTMMMMMMTMFEV
jgi:hypothetical protein